MIPHANTHSCNVCARDRSSCVLTAPVFRLAILGNASKSKVALNGIHSHYNVIADNWCRRCESM